MVLKAVTRKRVALIVCLLVAYCAFEIQLSLAQRENDDDFDDSGFDDSGYNSPGSHEAEGSNPNPSNYSPNSEEDLDDDDDTDETNMSARRARPEAARRNTQAQGPMSPEELQRLREHQQQLHKQQQQLRQQQAYYANQMLGPQRFYDQANSVMLANVAPTAFRQRYRRSVAAGEVEGDIEDSVEVDPSEQAPLVRRRRHSKYIGPVYTYVKTDKHARVKWGVKHKVGKHHG